MRNTADRVRELPYSATVQLADTAMELRRKGVEVVDLSAGRAVEPTPQYICRAASEAMFAGQTHQTASRGTPAFLQACAAKLARENNLSLDPEKEIIATLGVKQGLTLALLASVNPGDEVLVEDPCFVSYEPLVRIAGARIVPVPLPANKGFRWTRGDLESRITPRTRAILFNSPHNPTGTVHTAEDLAVIAGVARQHDLVVIADEVYERVTWGGRPHISIATVADMKERTIGVMGFTKSFSMGGWRIGYAYGSGIHIGAMVRLQQHLQTCANSFVQAAAAVAAATEPPPDLVALWRDWESRCMFVVEGLNRIEGIRCHPPEGGFYAWPDVSAFGTPSAELSRRLLDEHGLAIVPGSAFGPEGEGRLRLTCVRSWDELREAVTRLRTAFAALGSPRPVAG